MSIKQGTIALIEVIFTNHSGRKKRPVLVISNEECNQRYPDFVSCVITRQEHHLPHELCITNDDLASGHLRHNSYVKVNVINTTDKMLIEKTIGEIKPSKMREVKDLLNDVIKDNSSLIKIQSRLL